MDAYEPFIALAIALGVGLLIGIQREQSYSIQNREDGTYPGGIRTFPLYALAGAIAMLLAQKISMWLLPVILLISSAPLMIAYAHDVWRDKDRGVTTEIAFVLTFLLGALATSTGVIDPPWRKYQVIASIAVAITALLSFKGPLHHFAAKISRQDVVDAVKFLLLAVIVLPFLPDQTYGPLDVINPFEIGVMIVFIAAVGFIGYVLIRILGPGRGMGLTGLVGGLVSSTAVTLASAGRAKERPDLANVCALAIVLASTVMIVRIVLLIGAVEPRLLAWVAIPFLAMLITGLVCAVFFWRRQSAEPPREQNVEFQNPFALNLALKFGLIFAAVLLATKAATVYVPQGGVYVAALLAGLTDMDAISLSMARLAHSGELALQQATIAVIIAAASNTIAKAALALYMGGWLLGKKVLAAFIVIMAAGGLGLLLF